MREKNIGGRKARGHLHEIEGHEGQVIFFPIKKRNERVAFKNGGEEDLGREGFEISCLTF